MPPKKLNRYDLLKLAEDGAEFFTAEQLCGVLGTNAHTLRLQAKQAPWFLPEPLRQPIIGTANPKSNYYARVRWPVMPVLKYLGLELKERHREDSA